MSAAVLAMMISPFLCIFLNENENRYRPGRSLLIYYPSTAFVNSYFRKKKGVSKYASEESYV
ncbi:hypothetical protein ABE29_01665 [Cytobacillus firmus]|nr:hypothetical protein [Cytobacillus firmus]MBG9557292.1 hypothetical protein [Cytobacillus firmus]